jgi:hypothetical protein
MRLHVNDTLSLKQDFDSRSDELVSNVVLLMFCCLSLLCACVMFTMARVASLKTCSRMNSVTPARNLHGFATTEAASSSGVRRNGRAVWSRSARRAVQGRASLAVNPITKSREHLQTQHFVTTISCCTLMRSV